MADGTLLVAVDGSAPADRAVAHAISLVQRGVAGSLHLLNVQPPLDGTIGKLIGPETVEAWRRDEGGKALRSAETMCAQAAVPSESHIDAGRPGHVIAEAAQKLGCESIVVGAHGHTGAAGSLLGSVAQDVINRGKKPIWLVK